MEQLRKEHEELYRRLPFVPSGIYLEPESNAQFSEHEFGNDEGQRAMKLQGSELN